MKNIAYFFIGVFFISTSILKAQEAKEIEIQQNLGVLFFQNGYLLTPKQLLIITENVPEAYNEMKIAKSNKDIGSILKFSGGFLIGWYLGSMFVDENANGIFLGAGFGLVAVSIPFSLKYPKHAKKAVKIYNNSLKPTSMKKKDFNISFTQQGIGITMNL